MRQDIHQPTNHKMSLFGICDWRSRLCHLQNKIALSNAGICIAALQAKHRVQFCWSLHWCRWCFDLEQMIIIMNKQEYLSYFTTTHTQHNQQTEQSQSLHLQRPKTSHYSASKTKKLLPHIIEEYQYRITNELLSHKISHPRRDKLIAESFSNHDKGKKRTMCKVRSEEKENSEERKERKCQEGKHLSRNNKSGQIERVYKTFDDINSSCYNYKNDYLISLENNRMGKRLINTRSMVQDILTKTYYTYQIYNGKIVNRDKYLKINRNSVKFKNCNKNIGKVNNGIKCFFQNVVTEHNEHSQHRANASRVKTMHEPATEASLTHHGFETSNPLILQTYGNGELTFVITKLCISINPPLKPDAAIQLQLIEKDHQLSQLLNSYYAEKNNFVKSIYFTEQAEENYSKDCLTTAAFPYEYISSEGNFGIRFRMRYHSHVYLRILKEDGLSQRQLGVIRLNLEPFKTRVAEDFGFGITKQIRSIDGVEHYRQIYESQFEGHLYRFKKGEVAATMRLEYQLYLKGFMPMLSKSNESN